MITIAVPENYYYSVLLSEDLKSTTVKLTSDTSKLLTMGTPAVNLLAGEVWNELEPLLESIKVIEAGPGTSFQKFDRISKLTYPDPEYWQVAVAPGAPYSLVNFTCDSYHDAGTLQGRIYLCLGKQDSSQDHRGWGLVHIWRRHYPNGSYDDIMADLLNAFKCLNTDLTSNDQRYAILFKDVGSRRFGDANGSNRFALFDSYKHVTLLDWKVDRFNVITHFPSDSAYYRQKVESGQWRVCLKKPG